MTDTHIDNHCLDEYDIAADRVASLREDIRAVANRRFDTHDIDADDETVAFVERVFLDRVMDHASSMTAIDIDGEIDAFDRHFRQLEREMAARSGKAESNVGVVFAIATGYEHVPRPVVTVVNTEIGQNWADVSEHY